MLDQRAQFCFTDEDKSSYFTKKNIRFLFSMESNAYCRFHTSEKPNREFCSKFSKNVDLEFPDGPLNLDLGLSSGTPRTVLKIRPKIENDSSYDEDYTMYIARESTAATFFARYVYI